MLKTLTNTIVFCAALFFLSDAVCDSYISRAVKPIVSVIAATMIIACIFSIKAEDIFNYSEDDSAHYESAYTDALEIRIERQSENYLSENGVSADVEVKIIKQDNETRISSIVLTSKKFDSARSLLAQYMGIDEKFIANGDNNG